MSKVGPQNIPALFDYKKGCIGFSQQGSLSIRNNKSLRSKIRYKSLRLNYGLNAKSKRNLDDRIEKQALNKKKKEIIFSILLNMIMVLITLTIVILFLN